jgi:hypothetical protein
MSDSEKVDLRRAQAAQHDGDSASTPIGADLEAEFEGKDELSPLSLWLSSTPVFVHLRH